MRIAIVGGALGGNKGSASMVLALLDRLPDCRTAVLSLLAEDTTGPTAGATVVAAYGPRQIVLAAVLAPLHRLTGGRISSSAVRYLATADAVADVSGIAFVSGRGLLTLVYNVLLVLPALVLGRPVVKVAQALGPFDDRLTATAARLVLPRTTVFARGDATVRHLDAVGIDHEGSTPDVAFLMEVHDDDRRWAHDQRPDDGRPLAVVVPSQVVVGRTDDGGERYVSTLVALVDHLARDHEVVVMAHSARPGRPAGRLNDIPLCEQIVARVAVPERCRLVAEGTPRQLRALLGEARLVVTSRFHAMISALATGTPVFVVGWSHKYREVLREFDLEALAVDHRDITTAELLAGVDEALARVGSIRAAIAAHLDRVRDAAEANVDGVRAAARAGTAPGP